MRTWLHLCREVAARHYEFPDDALADDILWGQTGFPEFWMTDDPISECIAQLEAYFGGTVVP